MAWLTSRHESLRTTFSPDGAEQRIHPAMPVAVDVHDFSAVDAASCEPSVVEWFEAEAGHTFDLELGPLLKVDVLRLHDLLHLLVVTIHHAVCDGSSKWIILDELGIAYTALSAGRRRRWRRRNSSGRSARADRRSRPRTGRATRRSGCGGSIAK